MQVSCMAGGFFTTEPPVVALQSLSRVLLFAAPQTAALQAFLSSTISWSLLKLMSMELVMPPIVLCHPLLLLPSIFPSIKVFSNAWALFTFFFFHFYNVVISAIEHLLFKKTCNCKFFPCLFEICLLYSRMCLSWTWEPSL